MRPLLGARPHCNEAVNARAGSMCTRAIHVHDLHRLQEYLPGGATRKTVQPRTKQKPALQGVFIDEENLQTTKP